MNTPMNDDANKLFVAGLAEGVTDSMIRELFSEAGIAVLDVSLPRDRMTGRPRGFAFIRLNGPEDVDRALSQLNGHILGGASISVRRFNAEPPARGEGRPERGPRGPAVDTSDRTLYVGNLPYDATQEELEGTLRGAGSDAFTRVHLPVDADGRRRGFGFVTMASSDAAKAAVDQLRGVLLRGRPLVVNLAAPKGTTGGARPERSFGGPPGAGGVGGPPAPGADPRNASRFGPPAKPGGAKTDYGRKKKTEGEGARPPRSKRDHESRWSHHDDD